MGRGKKLVWVCDVCNHEWLSIPGYKPLRCTSCKTLYWDMNRWDAKKVL